MNLIKQYLWTLDGGRLQFQSSYKNYGIKASINQTADKLYSKVFDSEKYKATWVPQTLTTLIINGSEDQITPLDLFEHNTSYQRDNITIKEILGAGHYPWFENPSQVTQAFEEFYAMKLKSKKLKNS